MPPLWINPMKFIPKRTWNHRLGESRHEQSHILSLYDQCLTPQFLSHYSTALQKRMGSTIQSNLDLTAHHVSAFTQIYSLTVFMGQRWSDVFQRKTKNTSTPACICGCSHWPGQGCSPSTYSWPPCTQADPLCHHQHKILTLSRISQLLFLDHCLRLVHYHFVFILVTLTWLFVFLLLF